MPDVQLTVLIVDDNPEDRETARRYLARDPDRAYLFREAETGEDAWALLEAELPDALLLDYHLPDTNGLDFLDDVVRKYGPEAMAMVMFTGTGSEAIAVQSMKTGAHDYLVKGQVTAEGLRRTICNAVQRVGMRRQLAQQREELERKNRELRLADERKNEFLAVLAHELRNPLAATRNAVELIKVAGADPERFRHAVEILERQIRHQSLLLDDLLDISRITRGKILIQRERLDLAALVRDTIQDNRPSLEGAGLRVELEAPEEPLWVCGDPVRLSQVLDNLLGNAVKFTDVGGVVGLRLRREDEHAVIVVWDNGIGINEDLLPEIFEPFLQADHSLDRSRGGLGLGLALVRGLIALHGGEVTVSSAGQGEGAQFTIRIPLAENQAAAEADAAPSPGTAGAGGARRILLVEDNRDAADTLRDLLELYGHTLEVAFSGPSGVEKARQFRPDIVLCDLGLPGMDGFEVAEALRKEGESAGIWLIALSGYGQEEDRRRSRAAGFDHHLTKPVDPPDLEAFLRSLPPRP